jgi:hypothetical protein
MAVPMIIQSGINAVAAERVEESPCMNCKKEGYVAIFINDNGFFGHAAIIIGRSPKNTLFDPCGSYSKGKGKALENKDKNFYPRSRPSGDVFESEEFSSEDYYKYHRHEGPKINVYSFEIEKEEEELILERAEEWGGHCDMDCARRVSSVLMGIGPFKKIDDSYRFPTSLGVALKGITKMSTSMKKSDVINRMMGK